MTSYIHLVAATARTPVGLTAESAAAAVRAGISRLREHPFLIDAVGERLRCAIDPLLDPKILGPARLLALAQQTWAATQQKLTGLGQPGYLGRGRMLLALPELRPGLGSSEAGWIVRELASASSSADFSVELAGRGHAGMLAALALGVQAITNQELDFCVVVGVESYFQADTLDWLDAHKRVARQGRRSGFPPGEGACVLILASETLRDRRLLPSLAGVIGAATAQERRSLADDAGLLGEAVTDVVIQVSASLAARQQRIECVYCDINGERHRVDEWGFTLLRTGTLFRDGTDYVSAVSNWGDMGAATGGLNCVLATQAWRRGYAKGPHALLWGGSWGGLRAAVLLEEGKG